MAMTLITTNTSSGASASAFTSGIDSTYKLYIFKFYDVNPADDIDNFGVQFNASGQSGYNETITSTNFNALHAEDDSGTPRLAYDDGRDLAQGTGYVHLAGDPGDGGDESCAGELFLFNPSNTTYVKHFYGTVNNYRKDDKMSVAYVSGYINVTAAITGVNFQMNSGNFDGTIKLYGVG